jgi:putative ABC transport system permease protein
MAVNDLRYAARWLRASPGFALLVVVTLAVGIGGTTAIFSAVNPVLFQPLPYPDAGRIATILEMRRDGSRNDGTFGMYGQLVERSQSFDSIAVFMPWQPTMTGATRPERFEGQRVSASYFRVLGVSPVLGRDFHSGDDRMNGPTVVILSDALWRRRFNADLGIIGQQITLDETSATIVGVMPAGFENVLAPSTSIWAPLQYDMAQGRAWGHHLRTVGRLRPGVSLARASQELNTIGHAVLQELRPVTYGRDLELVAVRLQDELTRSVRPALLAILGAVALVLVIACVNVTNLLLARGVQRRGEFALRSALGAGRGRLVRQLLIESLLLSFTGGAVGMVVAILGVRALVALSPPGLPRIGAIGVDAQVFLFGSIVTTVIGVAFGLIPALQAARNDPQVSLRETVRQTAGGFHGVRRALVVAEIALALVLLVTSGLLLRSLDRLFSVPIGFDPSGLLTMQVQTSGRRFDDNQTTTRFFAQALEAVRQVPGVTSAAFTSQLPLSTDRDEYGVHFESNPDGYSTFRYAVSPGYVETMRIPIRRGRAFTEDDRAGTPPVALINESFARRRFPDADPIGKRLHVGPIDGAPFTIVGVVGDVKQLSLALSDPDAVYIPARQWRFGDNVMSLVVRGRVNAAPLTPAIRDAIWSVDKDQPIVRVATMDDLLAASAAERRFALILFEAFALAALVLAAAGIYGVLAGHVAERTREIGVRSALGATRADILGLILRQGLLLAGLGVVIGLAGAAAASQTISVMLFAISPLDPATYLAVIALLTVVAAIACGIPAWRAARVDPVVTLRSL